MADLDSLSIVLKASAGDATKAIDSIINALTRLNGALNNFRADSPYMKGLNNLASGLKSVRISLNGLNADNIKEVAKALDKMADSGSKLAKLTGLMPTMDKTASGMTQIVAASDDAYKKAEKIGEKLNFDSASDGVARLAEGIEQLQSAIGDDNAVREAMENIDSLLERYSRYKNELQELNKAQLEVIRTANIKLGHGAMESLGGDYETARRNRGVVGIGNTSKTGTNVSSIVDENTILGIEKEANEIDQLNAVMERTKQAAEGAKREFVGFNEASVSLSGGIEALKAETDDIARSMGIAADQMREAHSIIDDDFMSQDTTGANLFDDPAESIQQLRDSAQEAAPAIEALNNAEQHLTENSDKMAQVGNIFQGITTALESLQNITLSDSLSNLTYLRDAVSKFGGEAASKAAGNIQALGTALNGFSFEMPHNWSDLVALSQVFNRFGQKSQSKANYNILAIRNALERFKGLAIDPTITTSIAQLGDGLYKFGLAKMDKAVQNIPQLAGGMTQLITALANAPQVSESTIRLVTALGNVNVNGGQLNNTLYGMNRGLKTYRGHAISAQKASMSLAAAFGKMYANFFIFFRLARRFKQDIDLASDLTEVQNVVDVTFADMADKMNDFSKSAVEALGMSELTAKQIGSKYQAMGKAMGITPAMAQSTNEFVQEATNGYADVADSIADISINITRLAGDMASFYNMDYAEVAEKLQAIYTGQTRPLRSFGIDLTQATLAEFALKNGMDANIKTMTQAEKTLLRYQYVMAQTTAAHGDFQRTADTWANSVRVATEKLNQLRIVLGKIAIYTFKPLVQNFNKAMDQIIKGAEGLLNALGKIFGWKIEWSDAGVLQDESDDAGDLADNMGDAADNAKKFKNFLLGIDELNLLPDNSDKDKGAGGGIGDLIGDMEELGGFKITPTEKGFESLYDTLFKLGKRINEIIKQLLQGIDWEAVYRKAENFGRGLAKFVNGLLSDSETFYEIGKFLAGGINTLAHVIKAYHKEFDGWQWGVDLGNIVNGFTENLDWHEIQSAAVELAHDLAQTINGAFVTIKWSKVGSTIAEGLNTAIDYFYTLGKEIKWSVIGTSIAEGINGFFSTFDFAQAAETLNLWAKGLLDALIAALDRTDWKKVGKSIGEFIARIDVLEIAGKIVHALWEAINGAISAWSGMLETAPIETALATALLIPFSNSFFRRNFSTGIMNFARNIGTTLSKDLTKIFNGSLFRNFGSAFMTTGGQLDEFGNLMITRNASTLEGIANGFNAVSASLSTATKAIGGLGVGLVEFFTIKDAVYEIVHGTDNLGESIAKLSISAGIASVALSALLGVPTGLIVAGATAGIAAILGIGEAFNKISEENVLSTLSKDMGDSYSTMEDISQGFATLADNVTKDINGMSKEFEKVGSLKNDLATIVGSFALIGDAANSGNTLTSNALSELIGNLEDVKKAWEDYVNAQYDYLIQSTVNNMNFIKSQRELTDEEKKYFTDRINQLEEAKRNELKASTDALQKLDEAWTKYNNIKDTSVPTSVVNQAKRDVENATAAAYGLAESSGVLDEFSQKISSMAMDLSSVTSKITFENLDATDYETFLASIEGYNTQFAEKYANTVDVIQSYKTDLLSTGKYTEAQAEMETAAYFESIDNAAKNALDSVQLALYDKLYKFIGQNDYAGATDFYNNVMIPYCMMIQDQYSKATDGLKPWLGQKGGELIDSSFEYAYDYRDEGVGMGVRSKLAKGWQEIFWQLRDDVAPDAEKSGKSIMGNVAKGVSDGAKDISKSMGDTANQTEKAAKTTSYAFGDVDRAMGSTLQSSVLLKNGITDVNSVLENTSKSGEGIKSISDSMTGLSTVLGSIGTVLAPVKTGFDEFSEQTKTNMMNTSLIFGQTFNNIMKYGNQTISWLKGSFVPYFSGAYWSSITASIPNAFGNAFRQAINIMQNLWKQFATWANENMKINANVSKNGSGGAKVEVKVPTYSTGGFPEDGFFYANHSEMVGKFSNGQTAVANNEQIVEGIRQGVYEAVSAAMQGNGGQGVTVELVGDASDIFTAVVKENNRTIMRTGASPIRN